MVPVATLSSGTRNAGTSCANAGIAGIPKAEDAKIMDVSFPILTVPPASEIMI